MFVLLLRGPKKNDALQVRSQHTANANFTCDKLNQMSIASAGLSGLFCQQVRQEDTTVDTEKPAAKSVHWGTRRGAIAEHGKYLRVENADFSP